MERVRQATIYLAVEVGRTEAVADYTESNVRRIAYLLQNCAIDGAFIAPGIGMDSGSLEVSYAVTVAGYGMDAATFKARVHNAATALRDGFNQDCVLVTWSDVDSECSHDFAGDSTEGK